MATSPTSRGWDSHHLQDPIPGDVAKCLDELGVDIIRVVDDEIVGRCPGHFRKTGKEDRHPSWSVNVESGQHNCFSCGFRGPFYLIVKEVLGHGDEEAIAWVKARGSIDRARKILTGGGQYVHEIEEQITEADLALYEYVPTEACSERHLSTPAVDAYGVLWDSAKERWILPIREPETDRLMGWQEKGHADRYFRNYPKAVEKSRTLFGINELHGETAILVESPLDVVRLHTAGLRFMGVSSYGVHVSDTQLDVLWEAGVKILVSALDNDRKGEESNDALRKRVRGRYRLFFWDYGDTDAKDPGEQTDAEILRSYGNRYSSVLWRRSC